MQPRSTGQRKILDGLAALPLTPATSAYLEKRGLLEVATDLRLGGVPDSAAGKLRQYAGRLVIPSIGPEGGVYDVAFRCVQPHVCKDAECPKYLFLPGLDKRLYNLQAVASADAVLDVCEGQLDAATLVACGLHAVGVAGVNGWKRHHRRLLAGFDQVRVWGDGDTAGKQFAEKVCNDVAGAEVMMVTWGYDVNKLYVEQGRDAILKIAEGEDDDDTADDDWGLEPEPSASTGWPAPDAPPPF